MPKATKPREVVQMDTVDFGDLYAFTAIDIFTRQADVFIAPNLTAKTGYQFLSRTMKRRFDRHVDLVQTDGGPEFIAESKLMYTFFATAIGFPSLIGRMSNLTSRALTGR